MMAPRKFGNTAHRLRAKTQRAVRVLDKEDPEYWERLLTRNHLSMERGHVKWLSYGHTLSALDYDGVSTYATTEKDRGSE